MDNMIVKMWGVRGTKMLTFFFLIGPGKQSVKSGAKWI